MRLSELYRSLDQQERKALAVKAGVNAGYLWQIATGWRGKKPSVEVIGRLTKADARLTAAELIAEFSCAGIESQGGTCARESGDDQNFSQ